MKEKILNLYLVINNDTIEEFRGAMYEMEGTDDEKITYLKMRAAQDFDSAFKFDSPVSRFGKRMKYRQFARLEQQGKQFAFFEEIFQRFEVPDSPLVCVTPVVNGKVIQSS